MIFKFLRQLLNDHEYEQTKTELIETKAVLDEYKTFIQEQRKQATHEQEKADPDFIAFVWATLGFALYTLNGASKYFTELNQASSIVEWLAWFFFAIYFFVFILWGSWFALHLTMKYAESKSDINYKRFAIYLSGCAFLILLAVLLSALVK